MCFNSVPAVNSCSVNLEDLETAKGNGNCQESEDEAFPERQDLDLYYYRKPLKRTAKLLQTLDFHLKGYSLQDSQNGQFRG